MMKGHCSTALSNGRKNPVYKKHPTGRIKLGTESNGGFQNVAISNCVFDYCRGLALETVDGALLEDVTISNITMRDVVNDPIFLRLGSRMRGPKEAAVGAAQAGYHQQCKCLQCRS